MIQTEITDTEYMHIWCMLKNVSFRLHLAGYVNTHIMHMRTKDNIFMTYSYCTLDSFLYYLLII